MLTLAVGVVLARAATSSPPAATFVKALDAYFADQPYRTVVLVHEAMAKPDLGRMREAGLYMLGQSFASMHLYEKAEDSFQALLAEFPNGQFGPIALRELGRVFFNLHEYAAVVNLEQNMRGQITAGVPVEFWYLVGESNYLLGRRQQAREPLMRVPQGSPFFPFARYTLAQVEFSLDRPQAALAALSDVTSSPGVPDILRDRAIRISGMVLYSQRRYPEAMQIYRSIGEASPLYGQSRVDLALAADAAGDSDAARQAFTDAMEHASDDLIRTEATVAVGRFLNRRQKPGAARTLFEQSLSDLKTREGKLANSVGSDPEYLKTFGELVTFARQSGGRPRNERLAEDLQLLRAALAQNTGANYDHAPIAGSEKLTPTSYLFPLLQKHYHSPAIIETFVELAVEVEDLKKQVAKLETDIRGQSSSWGTSPPMKTGAIPEATTDALHELVWLLYGNYDLATRFYDALAINEKIDQATVIRQKQVALGATIEGLRMVLFGQPQSPDKQDLFYTLDAAREKIASGSIPGMLAQQVREGFLQEWKADRDSLSYVVDNLDLKERQMNSALVGVPLRARNVNLPVLSTMADWLTALQQRVWKYRDIDVERDQRPWYLAGKNEAVASILTRASRDLDVLEGQSQQVLRDVARDLVNKEQVRDSLIAAQAEEGIADALFQERSSR